MKNKFYGNCIQNILKHEVDAYVEEIRLKGFAVIEGFLAEKELSVIRGKIDAVYRIQEDELGKDYLSEIGELNIARALLVYDDYFLNLITQDKVLETLKKLLGDYFILHTQNSIINLPNLEHHQNAWHREFPYQNLVISKPIAINVYYCIDQFSSETGATEVILNSHQMETLPSDEFIEKEKVVFNCPAGALIFFDSMLFHKAGNNSSNIIRRGVNHVFSAPILKQQYDFPAMLNGKYSNDPLLNRLLGYDCQVPSSVVEWRKSRHAKLQSRKQK